MVTVGQEFKNYKELCKYLGEDIKTGKSKELQLKRWQLSFSWHTEGYRIIVDEVTGMEVQSGDGKGGNRKHVEVFMPYVIYCLYKSGINDEYVGTQRILKSELKLISSEIYEEFNKRSKDHSMYMVKHGLMSYESLTLFVHYFEQYAMETFERCLSELHRGRGVDFSPGQVFLVGESHRRPVYTIGYEEIIEDIETFVCNEMNVEIKNENLKGRQLLHVIKRDKKLVKRFYKRCIELLIEDENLVAGIKKRYEKKYKTEFDPLMIIDYYRVCYIGNVDLNKLRSWKLNSYDSMRLKKALKNPVGQEIQTLKKNVYEDIFHRMDCKKLGIRQEDFEKMKLLITNLDYSPKENKKQGGKVYRKKT